MDGFPDSPNALWAFNEQYRPVEVLGPDGEFRTYLFGRKQPAFPGGVPRPIKQRDGRVSRGCGAMGKLKTRPKSRSR